MILDEIRNCIPHIESHYTTLDLKYCYATPQEWINTLVQLSKSGNITDKYPFLYVNPMTVKDGGGIDHIVTIGEMVLATLSNVGWTAEQRKLKNFTAWLDPLYEYLIRAMKLSKDFSLVSEGQRTDHLFYGKQGLYGGEGNIFTDHIDAIEINNLQIRLY
jgi:hypothetical protein